jgi:hypothetical protein
MANGPTCQMITDWECDEHGERGADIACGEPSCWERAADPDMTCCNDCYASLDSDDQAEYDYISWTPELKAQEAARRKTASEGD